MISDWTAVAVERCLACEADTPSGSIAVEVVSSPGLSFVPRSGVESRSGAVTEVPFPDPAHQTGRAVFPHPAFGQGLGSFCPRQVGAEAFQSVQTKLRIEILISKAIALSCPDLVLVT